MRLVQIGAMGSLLGVAACVGPAADEERTGSRRNAACEQGSEVVVFSSDALDVNLCASANEMELEGPVAEYNGVAAARREERRPVRGMAGELVDRLTFTSEALRYDDAFLIAYGCGADLVPIVASDARLMRYLDNGDPALRYEWSRIEGEAIDDETVRAEGIGAECLPGFEECSFEPADTPGSMRIRIDIPDFAPFDQAVCPAQPDERDLVFITIGDADRAESGNWELACTFSGAIRVEATTLVETCMPEMCSPGVEGEPCCAQAGVASCAPGSRCHEPSGTCIAPEACGGAGEVCCEGTCDAGFVCDPARDLCEAPASCGADGEACCEGVCDGGLACEAGSCRVPSASASAACGASGQPCCEGGACSGGALCDPEASLCVAAPGCNPSVCESNRHLCERSITPDFRYASSGLVSDHPGYLYAPTVIYDIATARYKLWACGQYNDRDAILYKEAPTLEAMATQPFSSAFGHSANVAAFDHTHACDPSVLLVGGRYYLYYGGINVTQDDATRTTRIGVAVSDDGGRTFRRLHGGAPIVDFPPGTVIETDTYGIGQPAVALGPDGYIYMVYTHQRTVARTEDWFLQVIRSRDPSFATYENVKRLNQDIVGGFSVDLVYNPDRCEMVVVANGSRRELGANFTRLNHYDLEFNYLGTDVIGSTPGFVFGEGAGIAKTPEGAMTRAFAGGRRMFEVVASTVAPGGHPAAHVLGPMMVNRHTEGPNGLVPGFSLRGMELGVFNPFGAGTLYLRQGEGSGYFGDDTSWGWVPAGRMLSGDFDGDGLYDVALYNPNLASGLFIQYGAGDGTFGRQTSYPLPPAPESSAIAGDFDGDGRFDVGFFTAGQVRTYRGNGAGAFTPLGTYAWGPTPAGAQPFAGDFNGDGRFDVGYYDPATGDFRIRYGDGAGAFGAETNWRWGTFPLGKVVAGDFDADGLWDIGLHNPLGDGRIFMQRGNGTGAFDEQTAVPWTASGQVIAGHFR